MKIVQMYLISFSLSFMYFLIININYSIFIVYKGNVNLSLVKDQCQIIIIKSYQVNVHFFLMF